MATKKEFTLAELANEIPANKESKDTSTKYDNSHTVWVNGPNMEKFGVIQLRIPLEEFNDLYPEAASAAIGFKKTERSYQVVMKWEGKSFLIGTYFPPKGWGVSDIKATAGKRMFGFKPKIVEIEIDEDDLI